MNDEIVIPIEPVEVISPIPELTSRQDYKLLGSYAKAYNRGALKREEIPYRYRVHLPKTVEVSRDLHQKYNVDSEKFNSTIQARGWDKLEKAYGLGMSAAIATPVASSYLSAVGSSPKLSAFTDKAYKTAQHAVSTLVNPMKAKTSLGALSAISIDALGTATGLQRNSTLLNNWVGGNFHAQDIPEFSLNLLASTPYLKIAGDKIIPSTASYVNFLKGVPKRFAEAIVRMGDTAHIGFHPMTKQLFNKNTLSYLFNPNSAHKAYEMPFKYSGQIVGSNRGAHYGDMVDVAFGKTNFMDSYSARGDSPIRYNVIDNPVVSIPTPAVSYLRKNYPGRRVRMINLGDLSQRSSAASFDTFSEYLRRQGMWRPNNSMGVNYFGHYLVDPGGYNSRLLIDGFDPKTISGNFTGMGRIENYDIWKFNPKDYEKAYSIRNIVPRLGLRFIDRYVDPVITTWEEYVPIRLLNDINK